MTLGDTLLAWAVLIVLLMLMVALGTVLTLGALKIRRQLIQRAVEHLTKVKEGS